MINAINWPIDMLAVLPPLVFIVLIIAFPIIGVLAGWKRGLYWGGGTLLFYLLGMIIWRFAGVAIIAPFKDKIIELIKPIVGDVTITDKLLASVAAPVWFILIMFLGELILLINYYTWFKKKAGLKKIKVKDPQTKEVIKVYPDHKVRIQTTGREIANRLGGFASLGLLMIPSTVAFTQTLYCATTSPTTRATNETSGNVYNFLNKMNDGPFNWLSFYPNTVHDYDAIFSALALFEVKVNVPGYGETDVVDAVEHLVQNQIQNISDVLESIEEGTTPQQAAENIQQSINEIANVWNQISSGDNAESASALFSSPNSIDLISQMINFEGSATINEDTYEDLFSETGQVTVWVNEYVESGTISGVPIDSLVPIKVNEQSFNEFTNFLMGYVVFEEGAEEYQESVTNSVKDILGLLFNYPGMPESFRE